MRSLPPLHLLAFALLIGCGTREPEPQVTGVNSVTTAAPTALAAPPTPTSTSTAQVTAPVSQQALAIQKSTQATVGDLRIGAGNFWEEDVARDGAPAKKELTAALWLYVKNDSAQDRHVRVHVGQKVSVASYEIEVTGIEKDQVRVQVGKR